MNDWEIAILSPYLAGGDWGWKALLWILPSEVIEKQIDLIEDPPTQINPWWLGPMQIAPRPIGSPPDEYYIAQSDSIMIKIDAVNRIQDGWVVMADAVLDALDVISLWSGLCEDAAA